MIAYTLFTIYQSVSNRIIWHTQHNTKHTNGSITGIHLIRKLNLSS